MPLDIKANVHDQFQLPAKFYSMTACAHLGLRWKQGNRLTEVLRCRLRYTRQRTLPFRRASKAQGNLDVQGALRRFK